MTVICFFTGGHIVMNTEEKIRSECKDIFTFTPKETLGRFQKASACHNPYFVEVIDIIRGVTVGNPASFFEEEGPAYKVILDHAKQHNCDLIIMGSRGLSGVKEFLGSVSHNVIQHSPVPVLIIK